MIAFLILCIPTAWELFNDRDGDLNEAEDGAMNGIVMKTVQYDKNKFKKSP